MALSRPGVPAFRHTIRHFGRGANSDSEAEARRIRKTRAEFTEIWITRQLELSLAKTGNPELKDREEEREADDSKEDGRNVGT